MISCFERSLWDGRRGGRLGGAPSRTGAALCGGPVVSTALIACLAALSLPGTAAAQPRETWKGQPGQVHWLAVSPDGKTLACSTDDGGVTLWDLATGKKTATIVPDAPKQFSDATFTPDGKSLLILAARPESAHGKDYVCSAKIWNMATQKVRLTIDYPEGAVGGLLTPDSKSLIAFGPKSAVFFYDLATGKPSEPLDLGDDYRDAHNWALSPDGKTLAVGTQSDAGVLLFDLEKKATRATIPVGSPRAAARVLVFSPDGKTLASGNETDKVALWDAATGKPTGELDFDPRVPCIEAIAFSPDGKTLAVGGMRWGVSLWDLAAGGERDDFEGDLHTAWLYCIVFTPDGKTLISGSVDSDKDKAIWFWDVPRGKPAGVKPVGQVTPLEAKQLKALSH